MQVYRTTVIIGFLGVLLGGWLLIQRIGGIIDSVAVPLPKCPLAGLSLPTGSVVESETLEADGGYTVLFYNDQLPPKKVFDTMQKRFEALGLQPDLTVSVAEEHERPYTDSSGRRAAIYDPGIGSDVHTYFQLSISAAGK